MRTNNPTFGFGDVYCAWPRVRTVRGAWAQELQGENVVMPARAVKEERTPNLRS